MFTEPLKCDYPDESRSEAKDKTDKPEDVNANIWTGGGEIRVGDNRRDRSSGIGRWVVKLFSNMREEADDGVVGVWLEPLVALDDKRRNDC